MGITTLQVNLNTERMVELNLIKKARGIPNERGSPGYLSDDALARVLLLEKIESELTRPLPAGSKIPAKK